MIQLSNECLPACPRPTFKLQLLRQLIGKEYPALLLSGRASVVGPREEVGMVEDERRTLVSLLSGLPKMVAGHLRSGSLSYTQDSSCVVRNNQLWSMPCGPFVCLESLSHLGPVDLRRCDCSRLAV